MLWIKVCLSALATPCWSGCGPNVIHDCTGHLESEWNQSVPFSIIWGSNESLTWTRVILFQSGIVDKKSVMTYVMCMYQVLPHDDDNDDADARVDDAKTSNSVASQSTPTKRMSHASPLKVPPKVVTKGKTILIQSSYGNIRRKLLYKTSD